MDPKAQSLTLNSKDLFLTAHRSSSQQPPAPPPLSLSVVSHSSSTLPPLPPAFPPSKHIPKTRFLVDAFRHAGDHSITYFLSHFHSDHYTGLNPTWNKGIVFCSKTTARLLVQVLKVSSLYVFALPLQQTVVIDDCEITLIDANHCPGAVQFLFKASGGDFCRRYVHTGDFRFCISMKLEPALAEFVGSDAVFLDTTYCNPKFVFPSQEESVDYIIEVIDRIAGEYDGSLRNVLFLIATYVIGKEKILLEVASRCKRKICVDNRKMEVLRVLGYGERGVFTEDESESDVHVVGWNMLGETWPYFRPNFVRMKDIMSEKGYLKVVGFVPTGWTYEVNKNKFSVRSKDSFEIHLVPYSEHSNYDELREYVKFLKPKRVVPTVGADVEEADSKHADKMRKYFAGLVDEMANKQEFIKSFYCVSTDSGENGVMDVNNSLEDEMGPSSFLDNSSVLQSVTEEPTLSNNEEKEKIILEVTHCLPAWVTQSQVRDLVDNARGNVIETVSIFYKQETKFHEEVFTSQT